MARKHTRTALTCPVALTAEQVEEARKQYRCQVGHARRRKIEFKLSFQEWIEWWLDTGHYHERGPQADQYVMSRYGDQGAYELGNIFCQTSAQNIAESRSAGGERNIVVDDCLLTLFKRPRSAAWQVVLRWPDKRTAHRSTGTADLTEAVAAAKEMFRNGYAPVLKAAKPAAQTLSKSERRKQEREAWWAAKRKADRAGQVC